MESKETYVVRDLGEIYLLYVSDGTAAAAASRVSIRDFLFTALYS